MIASQLLLFVFFLFSGNLQNLKAVESHPAKTKISTNLHCDRQNIVATDKIVSAIKIKIRIKAGEVPDFQCACLVNELPIIYCDREKHILRNTVFTRDAVRGVGLRGPPVFIA